MWHTYDRLEKNSIDVLYLGSSKMYTFFNPTLFWHKYKFTSYNIAAALLDTHTQYEYLQLALKSQKPKLVVIDTYTLSDVEPELNPGQKENIVMMPFGVEKFRSAFQPRVPINESERWISPLEKYHSRLYQGGIKARAFVGLQFQKERKRIYMGYRAGLEPAPQTPSAKPKPLNMKGFNYNYKNFKRILDQLKAKNIKVIMVITPMANKTAQKNYNDELLRRLGNNYPNVTHVWSYDIQDQLNIDYSKDFTDPNHFTPAGAEKYFKLIGPIIMQRLNEDGPFKSAAYGTTIKLFNQDYNRYMKNYHPEEVEQ